MRKFILALTVCLLATVQFGRPANANPLAIVYGAYLLGAGAVAVYGTYKAVQMLEAHNRRFDILK